MPQLSKLKYGVSISYYVSRLKNPLFYGGPFVIDFESSSFFKMK